MTAIFYERRSRCATWRILCSNGRRRHNLANGVQSLRWCSSCVDIILGHKLFRCVMEPTTRVHNVLESLIHSTVLGDYGVCISRPTLMTVQNPNNCDSAIESEFCAAFTVLLPSSSTWTNIGIFSTSAAPSSSVLAVSGPGTISITTVVQFLPLSHTLPASAIAPSSASLTLRCTGATSSAAFHTSASAPTTNCEHSIVTRGWLGPGAMRGVASVILRGLKSGFRTLSRNCVAIFGVSAVQIVLVGCMGASVS